MERNRVDPKRLLNNINVLRENFQLMRRTLRGLIGIPLFVDMFENLPEDRRKSRRPALPPKEPGFNETPTTFPPEELAPAPEATITNDLAEARK